MFDASTAGLVVAAFIAAVPATIAALASWRGGRAQATAIQAGELKAQVEALKAQIAELADTAATAKALSEHAEDDAQFQEWIIRKLDEGGSNAG